MANASDLSLDFGIRSQIDLMAYANGLSDSLGEEFDDLDEETFAAIILALSHFDGGDSIPSAVDVARVEAVITADRQRARDAKARIMSEMDSELRRLGPVEIEKERKHLALLVGAGLANEILSANFEMAQAAIGDDLDEAVSSVFRSRDSMLRANTRGLLIQGRKSSQIISAMRSRRSIKTRMRHLDTIVQTWVSRVANKASEAFWKMNSRFVQMMIYVAVLDSRTTELCMSLSGNLYPVGVGPIPPMHYRCLLGDSLVSSVGGISSTFKRNYKGDIVTIKTSSGRELSGTPNHPILTDQGWVDLSLLNVGMKVVRCDSVERVPGWEDYKQEVPSRLEDICRSFSELPGVISAEVPVSAPDFHGDGPGSEVCVVSSYGGLPVESETFMCHACEEGILLGSDLNSEVVLLGFGRFNELRLACWNSSNCIMCGGNLLESLTSTHAIPLSDLGLTSCPEADSVVDKGLANNMLRGSEAIRDAANTLAAKVSADAVINFIATESNSSYGISGEAESLSDSLDSIFVLSDDGSDFDEVHSLRVKLRNGLIVRFTIHTDDPEVGHGPLGDPWVDAENLRDLSDGMSEVVHLDDIVSVVVESRSIHVYNLESESGLFLSDGIVTHNCRSKRRPVFKKWLGMSNPPDFIKNSFDGKAPADVNYDAFLRRGSRKLQDEALGPRRAAIYRKNKDMTVKKFVNRRGRKLTLKELSTSGFD